MHSTTGKMPSDSDVRLVLDAPQGSLPSDSDVRLAASPGRPGDSDVRLAGQGNSRPSDTDVTLIAEDTLEPGSITSSSGDTAVRESPIGSSSAETPAGEAPIESDSDFDLTPSGVIEALQPDSGSDFELRRWTKRATSSSRRSSSRATPT